MTRRRPWHHSDHAVTRCSGCGSWLYRTWRWVRPCPVCPHIGAHK